LGIKKREREGRKGPQRGRDRRGVGD